MNGNRCLNRYVCWALLWTVLPACVPIYGLQPEYPKVSRKLLGSPMSAKGYKFVEVDSLQPTLRWKSFPRPLNLKRDPEGVLNNISDVTYDLKILRVAERDRVDLVYSRRGLPQPAHTLEQPLEPESTYLWTVRARFVWEGKVRVSKWGVAGNFRAPRSAIVPNQFYYRFRTPRGEEQRGYDQIEEW